MRKQILRVVVIFLLSLAILIAIFGWRDFFTGTVDLQLHDTYFVTQSFGPLLLLFGIFGFISYFSTEVIRLFKNRTENLFLLGFTLLMLFIVFYINQVSGAFFDDTENWQVYPPGEEIREMLTSRMRRWSNIVLTTKVFLFALSGILIYRSFFPGKFRSTP